MEEPLFQRRIRRYRDGRTIDEAASEWYLPTACHFRNLKKGEQMQTKSPQCQSNSPLRKKADQIDPEWRRGFIREVRNLVGKDYVPSPTGHIPPAITGLVTRVRGLTSIEAAIVSFLDTHSSSDKAAVFEKCRLALAVLKDIVRTQLGAILGKNLPLHGKTALIFRIGKDGAWAGTYATIVPEENVFLLEGAREASLVIAAKSW